MQTELCLNNFGTSYRCGIQAGSRMIRQYGGPDRAPAEGEEGRPTGLHFQILYFVVVFVVV